MAALLIPRKGADRRRQQPERRGDFVVVGRKIDLKLDAGAAAGQRHRHGVAHQEDEAVVAVGADAGPG